MSFDEWLAEVAEQLGGEPDELDDYRREFLSLYSAHVGPREAADLFRNGGNF